MRSKRNPKADYVLLGVFLLSTGAVLATYFLTWDGNRWGAILLEPDRFAFSLSVLVPLLGTFAGVVMAYSLVAFLQHRKMGDLILLLVTANVVIEAFLFFLTHPALVGWSPFADRDKNRTIISLIGLVLAIGVVSGSLRGNLDSTKRRTNIALLLGAIAVPLFSLVLFASPVPVFYTVYPGTQDITPIGWTFTIIDVTVASVAFVSFLHNWRSSHRRFDLAFAMALLVWMLAILIYNRQLEVYEVSGLLWFTGLTFGFLILACAAVMTAVFDTHRELEETVAERTRELQLSREETRFLLNMWSHEIGNLLQGLVTYLELISAGGGTNGELNAAAHQLCDKMTLIIRQVGKLSQIKEAQSDQLKPMPLLQTITGSLDASRQILGEHSFSAETSSTGGEIHVFADDLLELVFVNLIIHSVRHCRTGTPSADIDVKSTDDLVSVRFSSVGTKLSEAVEESLEAEISPKTTAIGLDLLIVKVLVSRYGGVLRYYRDQETESNIFTVVLRACT